MFRYKLDGFDRDWIDPGTRRVAYYTNVPPGRYVFRVKAANSDGVWNETRRDDRIRAAAAFLRDGLVCCALPAGSAAAAIGVDSHRVRGLRRRERQLVGLV